MNLFASVAFLLKPIQRTSIHSWQPASVCGSLIEVVHPELVLQFETSLAQSRPFDPLVFPFWSIFSKGPKRLTFYFQVLWASEKHNPTIQALLVLLELTKSRLEVCGSAGLGQDLASEDGGAYGTATQRNKKPKKSHRPALCCRICLAIL